MLICIKIGASAFLTQSAKRFLPTIFRVRNVSKKNNAEILYNFCKSLYIDFLLGYFKMKSLREIKLRLESLKPVLKKNFSVDTIELFGSYVRGEQTEKSDLDVLVTFFEPNDVDLFKFIELRLFLKDELGLTVDLIEKDTLKPRLKGQILEEAGKV
jgi:predicted nucleotidyltransferase